jgi:perosamine synthetase
MITPHPTLHLSHLFARRRENLVAHNNPRGLQLTYNARTAFYQLLSSLPKAERDSVLLPAFHCTALVEPAVQAGYRTRFYRIRPDFTIDVDDLRGKLSEQTALVVVIHFFGFPADMEPILEAAKAYACFVVEDCAHSFLTGEGSSRVGQRGDFALFSYYKFAPSLAGGGLGINRADFALSCAPAQLSVRERLTIAKRLIEQAALNAPEKLLSRMILWLEKTRMANKQSDVGANIADGDSASAFVDDPYFFRRDLAAAEIPSLCRRVIEHSDWGAIATTRQQHYRRLSVLLSDSTAMSLPFPTLPDHVVPWAFPVLLRNRRIYEQDLRRLGVPLFTFGEVLHPVLKETNDEARQAAELLSSELLLLPVHASLTDDDVSNFARTLRQGLKANSERGELAQGSDGNDSILPQPTVVSGGKQA